MSTALQKQQQRFPSQSRPRPQHVPGRGGYSNAVHYRRETPEPEPPQPSQPAQTSNSPVRGIYNDPRTVMILCSFVGTQTTVKTRNGDRYKGHTVSFSEKGDIAMLDVKADDEHTKNPRQPGLIITKDDFVVCKTNGVDFKGLFTSSSDFTDSGIASRMNGSSEASMKILQPWHDDDAPDTNSSLLDDKSEGWDSTSMFQANRDKFNVQSTYNEDLHEYTTKLPDPNSEGYEEKEKFAQKHADAIERSEIYQARIAKELKDGDEEALFSAVHRASESGPQPSRHQESNSNSGKHNYIAPGLREEGDQMMRNDTPRTQGRGPFHSSHPQQPPPQHSHQNMQPAARQMNNQFHGSPPAGAPSNRNQGPPQHQRQQNHAAHLHHPASQFQQPPPLHPGMPQHVPPGIPQHHQQQRSPPHHHQQSVSSSQPPGKPHPPHSYSQNIPSAPSPLPPQSHQLPPQTQHPPPQKPGPQYKQSSIQQTASIRGTNVNGPLGPPPVTQDIRQSVPPLVNKEAEKCAEVSSPTTSQVDSQQVYHQKPPISGPPPVSSSAGGQKVPEAHMSASSSSSSLVEAQQVGPHAAAPAAQTAPAPDRRVGRGAETSPEERNKIDQSLHDFQKNFILESNGGASQEPVRQDSIIDSSAVSSSPTTSNVGTTTTASTAPEASVQLTEQAAEVLGKAESLEESSTTPKYKLNPNAKEFKPKSQPVQMETQSPSPQPRSSPHMPQMVHYPPQQTVLVPYPYIVSNQLANSQRKRATVSLGAGVVSDLAAHQVTGQPLLATQPHSMMYLQHAGQALPTAYQFYASPMISPRMIPGSLAMAQTGQVAGLDQTGTQHQPQPVFITAQQQPLHTPIPAHLHPQQTHAQAIALPPTSQQAQPAHVPNPVPSPVQHQQQNSQPMPQPMPHHISQGPPQSSATPQPAHYPQMTVNYTNVMPAVPRTSMSGQQSLTAGHSSVNFISAPQFQYNGGAAQYTFAPAPQPQTSQNSSHGPGPQPQYVIMPQPSTQAHPPIQQHTAQPFTGPGIPFQPQQHFMQGPPHMPPNHTTNPAQNSSHLMHPGLSGIHQQISSNQPNMYMQVPSTLQQYQHQQ